MDKVTKIQFKRIRNKLGSYRTLKHERELKLAEYNEYLNDSYDALKAVVVNGMPKTKGMKSDITGETVAKIDVSKFLPS